MHVYNRLSSNAHSSPSPPSSPRLSSPRLRHGKSKSVGMKNGVGQPRGVLTFMQKSARRLLSVIRRHQGLFLFAPLIYISGMLLYMGTASLDAGGIVSDHLEQGSVAFDAGGVLSDLEQGSVAFDAGGVMSDHLEQGSVAFDAGGVVSDHLEQGSVAFDAGEVVSDHLEQGSVYRSPQVFENLWPAMQVDNETHSTLIAVWQYSRYGERWEPCIKETMSDAGLPPSNGYIFVEANGGLNQQRVSICNAVAVAYLLNSTLVIPHFHLNSIWKDPSKFKDIYDEEYFINTLRNDVRVVRKLPEAVMEKFDNNMRNIFNFKAKAWSPVSYYEEKVLPKLLEDGVIRISPFANRLSKEVPPLIQRMRCLANYEALRFVEPIATLADQLVQRMFKHSSTSSGKYIAVHLRFEEDMVAFSSCVYDGGKQEKEELDVAREKGWRGKFNRTGCINKPGQIRMNGKCPLTPVEVGMMLRGMGFDNNTAIYLASGKIYKAEKNMLPLKKMFPLLQTKESLARTDELTPFKNYSSRMAALDYTVCLHSEVFVTTQGGNFPHFLMGHRRYFNEGHSKTIKPDKRKLALLFDDPKTSWKTFKQQMYDMRHHSDVKGIELRKFNASVYTFPALDCMCQEKNMENLEAIVA